MKHKIVGLLRKFARFILLGAIFTSCSFSWGIHQARANLSRETNQWSRTLLDTLTEVGIAPQGDTHQLLFNGMPLEVEVRSLDGDPKAMLDRVFSALEGDCAMAAHPAALPPSSGVPVQFTDTPLFDSLHTTHRNRDEAHYYCIKPGYPLTFSGIWETAKELQTSGDLASLGTFQGVYARIREGGLMLMSVRVNGSFVPEDMFPRQGDAPGVDFIGLPRPPGRRLLSVSQDGHLGLNTYEQAASPREALKSYEALLMSAGATVEQPKRNSGEAGPALLARTEQGSFVVVATEIHDGALLVVCRLPG